jgi:hypothetical protein
MSEQWTPDIVKRLLDACNGHPDAKIPWPHKLLHDAVEEIRGLIVERAVLKGFVERKNTLIQDLQAQIAELYANKDTTDKLLERALLLINSRFIFEKEPAIDVLQKLVDHNKLESELSTLKASTREKLLKEALDILNNMYQEFLEDPICPSLTLPTTKVRDLLERAYE